MPTGYTASVADGTVTDLKTFALRLARGMGALVMMRDEPWDAPIPDQFEPSQYHVERLKEIREERSRLLAMTNDEIRDEIVKECKEFDEHRAKARREHDEKKARYEAMIAKVKAWKGAPDGIKGFALDQLRQSLEFDCREPYRFWGKEPETDPELWHEQKLEANQKELEYHMEKDAEETRRTRERNKWLRQLRESLA